MMNSRIPKKKNSVNEKGQNFDFPKNLENICELSNTIDLIPNNKESIEINQDQPLPFPINGFHAISSGTLMPSHGDGAFSPNVTLEIVSENAENLEKTQDYMLISNNENAGKQRPSINQNQAELNCSIIVQFILKESFANYSILNQTIHLNIANGIASENGVNYT